MSTSADGTELYIAKIKDKASPTGVVLEKIRNDRLTELDNLRVEAEIARVKSNLQSAGGVMTPQQQASQQAPSNTALASLFVGKSPEEISKLLDSLTPDQIRKLQLITSNMNTNQLGTVLDYVKKDSTSMQDMLAMFKTMLEIENMRSGGSDRVTARDLIEVFKAAKGDQGGGNVSPTEFYKTIQEATRPFIEVATKAKDDAMEAKMNELKANMPGSLQEQAEYVKEMAGILGYDKGNKGEIDLRLEEMRQNREVDIEKLRWEQEKYKLEKEGDDHKWDLIAQIVQGPIGEVLKNIGAAGAERMRPRGNNGGSPPRMPKPIQVDCPNCHDQIFVDQDAMQAVCGRCGAVLQRTVQAAPPPPPPPAPQPIAAEPPPSLEDSTHVEEAVEESPASTEASQPQSEAETPMTEEETTVEQEETTEDVAAAASNGEQQQSS